MQIQVFSIPMEGDEEATQQLNLFLRTHKVLSIDKAPVIAAGRQYWSVCVEFLPRRIAFQSASAVSNNTGTEKQKIDYRQVLNPAEFARYNKLRCLPVAPGGVGGGGPFGEAWGRPLPERG